MSLSKTPQMKDKKGATQSPQLKHLSRIEGQVRGVSKMIEERRYCIDILTQLKAIRSSISSIEKKIINEHLNHCVHKAVSSKNMKETNEVMEEIKELLKTTKF